MVQPTALLLMLSLRVGPATDATLSEKLVRFLEYTAPYADGIKGSVLVAKNGQVLVEKAWGVADAKDKRPLKADSLYDIASTTKQFTAALALRLEMEKKLSLDDPLCKYFPKAPDDKAKVTLRQLLNHTSGIANSYDHAKAVSEGVDFGNRDSAIAYYLRLPMAAKPGTAWAYSNLGYNLAAAIIEKATGKTWEAAMRQYILEPAGLKDTWCLGEPGLPEERVPLSYDGTQTAFPYGKKSHWAGYVGAGGIHSTVRDMYNWDRALRGEKVLSKAAKAKLYKVELNNYALGWETSTSPTGKRIVSHGGAVPGFLAQFTRGLDDDIVVVILVNNFNVGPVKTMAETLYNLALTEEDYAATGAEKPLPPGTLDGLVGTYRLSNDSTVEVALDAGRLVLRSGDWGSGEPLARMMGFMTGGMNVQEQMDKSLAALKEGNAAVLEQRYSVSASEEARRGWTERLRGGAKGKLKSWKLKGAYFTKLAEIDQFIHVDYENGEDDILVHWTFAVIASMQDGNPWVVSMPLKAVGPDRFLCDVKTESWQKPSVRFEKDASGKVDRLVLIGGQGFTAVRTKP
jgi:CubicO group peptidase (beta-lactamase class C family)